MKISTIFDFGSRDRMDHGIDLPIDDMTDEVIEEHFASVCEGIKGELAKRRVLASAPGKDST